MKDDKGRRQKRFCGFWKSKKKKKEPSDRMDEVQSRTNPAEGSEFIFSDLDGNVIEQYGSRTAEIMHPDYKQHIAKERF